MPKTRTSTPAESGAASAAPMTPTMKALLDLLSADHGTTAAELARRAGIGRSTAAKSLAALERVGSARREPGARTGKRPEPDRWFVCAPSTAAHIPALDSEAVTAGRGESRDERTGQTEGVDDTPERAPVVGGEVEPDTADPAGRAEPADSPQSTALAADGAASATGTAAPADGGTPSITGPQADQAESATSPRLAKGGLRALVLDYLTAHPDEETTAPAIGKSLGRSSGAVANALDTLVKNDQAELTCEKPRKFRHRTPQTGN